MRLSLFLALLALPGVKSSDDSDYQRRCEENDRRLRDHFNQLIEREEERNKEMEINEARRQAAWDQDLKECIERFNEYKREKDALERDATNN